MRNKGTLIAAFLVAGQLPWGSVEALTVHIGNEHDRQAERREERRHEERTHERYRDTYRRDGRHDRRDHQEDDFQRADGRADKAVQIGRSAQNLKTPCS